MKEISNRYKPTIIGLQEVSIKNERITNLINSYENEYNIFPKKPLVYQQIGFGNQNLNMKLITMIHKNFISNNSSENIIEVNYQLNISSKDVRWINCIYIVDKNLLIINVWLGHELQKEHMELVLNQTLATIKHVYNKDHSSVKLIILGDFNLNNNDIINILREKNINFKILNSEIKTNYDEISDNILISNNITAELIKYNIDKIDTINKTSNIEVGGYDPNCNNPSDHNPILASVEL